MRNNLSEDLMFLVFSMYHLKARTGQIFLSSLIEEEEEMFGR